MRIIYLFVGAGLLLASCQPPQDNSADEAFQKNSQTVLNYLKGWQNENVDYSIYSADFVRRGTGFGDPDTIRLADMQASDKRIWEMLDFKLIGLDSLVLLPGVNVQTLKPDGSVRYYGDWEVTLPATDSTEARTAIAKLYESFDFDADGKIIFQQAYADFGGTMAYLMSPGKE